MQLIRKPAAAFNSFRGGTNTAKMTISLNLVSKIQYYGYKKQMILAFILNVKNNLMVNQSQKL